MWHPRVRFKSYQTRTSLARCDLNLTLGCHRFYYLAPLPVLDPIYLFFPVNRSLSIFLLFIDMFIHFFPIYKYVYMFIHFFLIYKYVYPFIPIYRCLSISPIYRYIYPFYLLFTDMFIHVFSLFTNMFIHFPLFTDMFIHFFPI